MKISSLLKITGFLFLLACGAFAATTNSLPEVAKEKTKTCFNCKGVGKSKCPSPTCKDGQADCPGPCLKLSKGAWIHMQVEGHPPTDLWQKFYGPNGKYAAWNQNHVGEVIQYQNGEPVNTGKCPICGGTAKIKCPVCKGAGEAVCPICEGKKVVPESWTAFDNPKMKDRPTHYKLKDGSVVIGRKKMSVNGILTVRTEKGDVNLDSKDIVSEEKPAAAK